MAAQNQLFHSLSNLLREHAAEQPEEKQAADEAGVKYEFQKEQSVSKKTVCCKNASHHTDGLDLFTVVFPYMLTVQSWPKSSVSG